MDTENKNPEGTAPVCPGCLEELKDPCLHYLRPRKENTSGEKLPALCPDFEKWCESDAATQAVARDLCGTSSGTACDGILLYLNRPDCSPATRERIFNMLSEIKNPSPGKA